MIDVVCRQQQQFRRFQVSDRRGSKPLLAACCIEEEGREDESRIQTTYVVEKTFYTKPHSPYEKSSSHMDVDTAKC